MGGRWADFWPPNVGLVESHAGQVRVLLVRAAWPMLPWRGEGWHVSWPAGQAAQTGVEPWKGFVQPNMTWIGGRWGFEAIGGATEGFYYFPIRGVTSPYWAVVTATAILPTRLAIRWTRAARLARQGHCPACGYDLRASSGRCPECGTVAATTQAREEQIG
ncbi:MAG TPA: hypothetical protein VGB55_08940 [Tepidisphaeraceae bacterium]